MANKRSQHELKRLVERAIADACGLPRSGLWLCVDAVETHGWPYEKLKVWATLHFMPQDLPFCCGEAGCHLGLSEERIDQISHHVRRSLQLRQDVVVDVDGIGVNYHTGVRFHYGHEEPDR